MAPTSRVTVEWQTAEIIKYLLTDEIQAHLRCFDPCLETDSKGPSNDEFDPVLIADKLRRVADDLNNDPRFQAALTDMKQAAAQEAIEVAFSHGVKALCQTQVSQTAEVAQEMQIIKASIALGLYIKKKSPDLKSKVEHAMMSFLTSSVGPWIAQQGGWDKVV